MQARKTLRPGQDGTKSRLDKYGEQLLCVRYRYDEERHLRHTTVELVVETVPYHRPTPAINRIVGVRVGLREVELQRQVKQAGGKWSRERRLWELGCEQAVALGLQGRIEELNLPNIRKESLPNIRQGRTFLIVGRYG
jgi:hypothetical protein